MSGTTCPIRSSVVDFICAGSDCAWWTDGGCAVKVLAVSPLMSISVERAPEERQ